MPAATLKVQLVPVEDIHMLERNARRGDVEAIRESLRAHGQYIPIVVRKQTGEILKGNHTYLAAREEGFKKIAVIYRDVESDEEAKRLALVDNRTSDLSEWDWPELADTLTELAASAEGLAGTGFDEKALNDVISRAVAAADELSGDDPADPPAPDPPARPTTKRGDLILLGRHRLLCGDSTDPGNVERLLEGLEPLLLNTDPPYGVDLELRRRNFETPEHVRKVGGRNTNMAGDSRVDWSNAYVLCPTAVIAYVWHASQFTDAVIASLEGVGYERAQVLIWVKSRFVMGRSLYHWQHEPCWIARRKGVKTPWHGSRNQSTVINAPSPKLKADEAEGKWDHPTQKPLAVCMPPIANHLLPGQYVYDPFCGSGSTLIAAEHLDRGCAGMEIDPGYCDVIVQRWEELTGETAERPARLARKKKAA